MNHQNQSAHQDAHIKQLEVELKTLIIEALELEDIKADDLDSQAPLFGGELGLDSIDALELGVVIQKEYQVTINADDDDEKTHFASINSLARYLAQYPRPDAAT